MGRVLRAFDVRTMRKVAIKLMHAQDGIDLVAVQRFEREMHATTKLEHPNTIRVYDYGRSASDELYLVMELIDGQTVSGEIARIGPLPIERVVRIAVQVARALAAAHANKIVHRDLKPSNVMIRDLYGERDLVTVLDFGIADLQGSSRLTGTGLINGSPAYCSPEAANGAVVGPRGDLYQLGVMMYECLVARLPFESDTAPGFFFAHVHKLPERPSAATAWGPTVARRSGDGPPRERPCAPPRERARGRRGAHTRGRSERVCAAAPRRPDRRGARARRVDAGCRTRHRADAARATEGAPGTDPDALPIDLGLPSSDPAPKGRALMVALWVLVVVAGVAVYFVTRPTPDPASGPITANLADTIVVDQRDVSPGVSARPAARARSARHHQRRARSHRRASSRYDDRHHRHGPRDQRDTSREKKLPQRVISVPEGAQISRNGKPIGTAPYTESRITEGESVRLECYIPNREVGHWRGVWGSKPVVCVVGEPF